MGLHLICRDNEPPKLTENGFQFLVCTTCIVSHNYFIQFWFFYFSCVLYTVDGY